MHSPFMIYYTTNLLTYNVLINLELKLTIIGLYNYNCTGYYYKMTMLAQNNNTYVFNYLFSSFRRVTW